MRRLLLPLLLLASCASGAEVDLLEFYDWLEIRQQNFNSALASQDVVTIANLRRSITRNAEPRAGMMLRDLDHVDNDRRLLAIFGLAFVPAPAIQERLGMLLGDVNPLIRSSAAASIGMQNLPGASPVPLLQLLEDPDDRVRQAALFGIWQIVKRGDDKGTLPAVMQRLTDDVPTVRSEAYVVLRVIALSSTMPTLVEKGLKDSFEVARMNAATALGAMGPDAYDAVPALIEGLRDPVHEVVLACWHALRRITGLDMDRSYHRWRDWNDKEKNLYVYVCSQHSDVSQKRPGTCPKCGTALKREFIVTGPDVGSGKVTGHYACPNHADVRATVPMICLQCGERLVPTKEGDPKEPPK